MKSAAEAPMSVLRVATGAAGITASIVIANAFCHTGLTLPATSVCRTRTVPTAYVPSARLKLEVVVPLAGLTPGVQAPPLFTLYSQVNSCAATEVAPGSNSPATLIIESLVMKSVGRNPVSVLRVTTGVAGAIASYVIGDAFDHTGLTLPATSVWRT